MMMRSLAAMAAAALLLLAVVSLCVVRYSVSKGGEGAAAVHGDPAGLERVALLDRQMRDLAVKPAHPRIILTPELIATARSRIDRGHKAWNAIRQDAAKDTLSAAFCYAVTGDKSYAARVYEKILSETATPWAVDPPADAMPGDRKVAEWAIAFDWVFNGLSREQVETLTKKIAAASNIAGRAAWLKAGNRIDSSGGETFHREEWIFWAWRAWPEIALAGHDPEAEFCYKSRWSAESIYGDAARAYAYLNDGTPLEGYQYGADATSWLLALKSATGINLIDGKDFRYAVEAADYQLYGTDFGLNRNVFHHGVGIGAGGLATYKDTSGNDTNWKTKENHSLAVLLTAKENPYQQWIAQNLLTLDKKGASSWFFSNDYYRPSFSANVATLLFYDPSLPAADPRKASYEELPYAKHFPGGNEVYMRSSWGNNAAMACFRSAPAFTMTSHGDFDVNTFILYRKGNLAPDSGVYDAYQGQSNYFGYQKKTVAHNDILIVDPSKPDEPKKFNSPDPGGTEMVTTRTFGRPHTRGLHFTSPANTFLNNDRADWGDIVSFETTRDFDYAVGDAAKAYGSRAEEYTRTVLFLRKNADKAYFVVFDRVGASNAGFKKKWLLHTVSEPALNGKVTASEVPGHIYTTDGDTYSAANAFNNAALYGKVLLPKDHLVRKVGGEGYEFWLDGSKPVNVGINWRALAADKEPFMGGPIQEIGQWRLEVMPSAQQKRDLFLNVIYLGDTGENPASVESLESADGNMTGAFIRDEAKPWVLLFPKEKHGKTVLGPVTYRFPLGGPDPVHVITGLASNAPYTVKCSVDGSTALVSIVPGTGAEGSTAPRSSAVGVLHFVAGAR